MRSLQFTFTIPFAFKPSFKQVDLKNLTLSQKAVMEIIRDNPMYKKEQMAKALKLSTSRISQIIKELKEANKIKRVGSNKSGYWKVN